VVLMLLYGDPWCGLCSGWLVIGAGKRRHVPGAAGAAAGLTSAAVAHAHEGPRAAVQGQGRIGRWNGNPM
jgi:hypothetical protein